MQFTFLGFTQDTVFRVFLFERVANDRTKTAYAIRVDLALSRKHGIGIQELPLLCRSVLERDLNHEPTEMTTFTESEMLLHARTCAEARASALVKKKAIRRPLPSTLPARGGWRGSIERKTAPAHFPQSFGGS